MSPPLKLFSFKEGDHVLKEGSDFIYVVRKCFINNGHKKYQISVLSKITTVDETQLVRFQCECELFPYNYKVQDSCIYRGLF
jgi:hypothetical protein